LTRAVFDPNVVIAAAIRPGGAPADCLRAHAAGRFELIVSPLLLTELRTVLVRKKFRSYLTVEHAARLVDALARDARLVADPAEREPLSRDPGDDYLVALARAVSAHVLVSGDDDLLSLDIPGLAIVSPRAFLELLP
jgi:putative PIN family toxin of toxin-antitoxin system